MTLSDMAKTILMNKPNFEERVDGLYPTPEGNVYFTTSPAHDGELTFYAKNDECAINYIKAMNPRITKIERIHFNYNDVYPKQEFNLGLTLNMPLGNFEVISKGDEEDDWGMTGKLLHITKPMTGILLQYADYPNYDWNIFVPEKHVIIMVPVKSLKESNP
jgi:hypothetical protein